MKRALLSLLSVLAVSARAHDIRIPDDSDIAKNIQGWAPQASATAAVPAPAPKRTPGAFEGLMISIKLKKTARYVAVEPGGVVDGLVEYEDDSIMEVMVTLGKMTISKSDIDSITVPDQSQRCKTEAPAPQPAPYRPSHMGTRCRPSEGEMQYLLRLKEKAAAEAKAKRDAEEKAKKEAAEKAKDAEKKSSTSDDKYRYEGEDRCGMGGGGSGYSSGCP